MARQCQGLYKNKFVSMEARTIDGEREVRAEESRGEGSGRVGASGSFLVVMINGGARSLGWLECQGMSSGQVVGSEPGESQNAAIVEKRKRARIECGRDRELAGCGLMARQRRGRTLRRRRRQKSKRKSSGGV